MNDLTVYNKYRSEMKTGDCLLYRSKGSLIGWMIQRFTDFNHAGLVVRFGKDDFGADRMWTLEAVGSGVVPVFLSSKVREYHGEVWWYPLKDEFEERRPLIRECAMILKNTGYDFKSLIKNILGYVSVNMNKLFCSEYVYVTYAYSMIPMAWTAKFAPRPGDVPDLGIFKEPVKLT